MPMCSRITLKYLSSLPGDKAGRVENLKKKKTVSWTNHGTNPTHNAMHCGATDRMRRRIINIQIVPCCCIWRRQQRPGLEPLHI